ncbi:MAG: hypothetical protein K0S09_550 [Sphingobacteriaceae bacterium]|jgi:hypothetical protein|nr:hypothetical protein [Sphingobacteriaceae bacterium]
MYFSKLNLDQRSSDKALSLIPADAAAVLEFTNDKSFQEIFKGYPIFEAVIGKTESDGLTGVQQLITRLELLANTERNETYLSFHHSKTKAEVGLLWLMTLPKSLNKEDIYDALLSKSPNYSSRKISLSNADGIEISFSKTQKPFYFSIQNNTAVGSFSEPLLRDCLGTGAKINDAFAAEIISGTQNNHNSLVNLFLNHAGAAGFFERFFSRGLSGYSSLLKQASGYSTLNLNFKSDALMFNGIATVDTTTLRYFNLFRHQKPVSTTIIRAFPESTANYTAFAVSDYKQFNTGLNRLLNTRNELKKLQHQFDLLRASSGIDIDEDVKKYYGNEFAVLELSGQQKLAVIKLTNGANMSRVLNLISRPVTEQISELNNANIFYYSFGDPMLGFPRPFFITVDNYLVLANAQSTLQQFLFNYLSENLLVKTPAFANFNQYIANQSNISYFVQIEKSKGVFNSVFKSNFANKFKAETFGLDKFYGLSYQWSADGGHFFTNIYANLADTTQTETTVPSDL